MKAIQLVLVLVTAVSGAHAVEPVTASTTALPAPVTDGSFSVERALHERRSWRDPTPTPLALAQVGQLCWAAQGVTDDKGHRTAPSAMAVYPLDLYVLAGAVTDLAPGLYRYATAKHALELVATGDARQELQRQAVGQEWIAQAPAIFVITGSAVKMARMKERAAQFLWTEAGLAAQGFFLEATAMGLGSTYVGGFEAAKARAVLHLGAGQEVLAVLPVGHRP